MAGELTTAEVKRLTKELVRYVPEERRERFLPTRDQTKVLISFLRAAEACESVTRTAVVRGMTIPKRSLCVGEKFKDLHESTLVWAERNPADFEDVYKSIAYK